MMEWKNVSLKHRDQFRLRDVSFRLKGGGFTAVLGPNGAGKSSLIKLCAKELIPSEGRIELDGRDLAFWSYEELARVRAVLSQSYHLPLPLRVEEMVAMGRYPHIRGKAMKAIDHQIVAEAIDLCRARALMGRQSQQLSGGELQRVQLARVLSQIWQAHPHHMRCLFLDEPTANLDPAFQHLALRLAQNMAKRGVCVVAVLHDINLAAQYADQIIFLKEGCLEGIGPTASLLTEQWIQRVFDVEVCRVRDHRLAGPRFITLGRAETA